MMIRAVVPLVLVTCLICRIQTGLAAEADDLTDRTYSLDDIVALAMEHSPALASAEGLVKQSHGRQIAAEAYPNPSVAGTLGRGAIRDPSNGIRVTERTFTVEQPIEWGGKRQARREVADAGFAEASATLEVAKLTVVADVKEAFYRLLFAQRDAELAIQNVATVEEVLRIVKTRVAAGEATSFDTLKAGVEVQKAQKEVARAQNELVVARTRLNTLTTGVLGKQFSIRGDFRSLRPGA
ncbi:TolC family protein, partial [Petrachloros mirabilis]